jgi:GNAT superfamily N-acetyltransferase
VAAPLIGLAVPADVEAIVGVRDAAADALTERFGQGHWSGHASASAVRRSIGNAREWVIVSRARGRVTGTLALQTKKPWAIEVSHFSPVDRPLYLVSMAVLPRHQGKGIGRRLLAFAEELARERGFEAIRLDSYDASAGAGDFYASCGWAFRGTVKYKGNPLRYYERLVSAPDGSTPRSRGRKGKPGTL